MIGADRAFVDGKDCAYICDVVIHPQYQGMGIGSELVNKLVDALHGMKKLTCPPTPEKKGSINFRI